MNPIPITKENGMDQGMRLLVFPVKDLAKAKPLYRELLGVDPYADAPYYVGFRTGDRTRSARQDRRSAALLGGRRYQEAAQGVGRRWRPAGPGRARRRRREADRDRKGCGRQRHRADAVAIERCV